MAYYELAHPLYLDVQMMTSFLAFLEGGYSMDDEQTSTSQTSREAEGKASAKAKTPLFHLGGLEAGIEGDLARKLENTIEYKAERHRTESSLFNYLYKQLHKSESIKEIESVSDLDGVHTGQLVELFGAYQGNPLAEVLALTTQYLKYISRIAEEEGRVKKQASTARRSGSPATRAAASQNAQSSISSAALTGDFGPDGRAIMQQLFDEMSISPVQDVVVSSFSDLSAVLTVSTEYFTDMTRESLREGEVRVMGKLTRILGQGQEINLSRRSLMGVVNDSLTQNLPALFANTPQIRFRAGSPLIQGPAVQILPMAIFV